MCVSFDAVVGLMVDESKQREPMPPVLWWLFGMVGLCFVVLWGYGGFHRTIWWLGLLIGSVAVAVGLLRTRDRLGYESGSYQFADAVMRLSWIAAALIFLFGILTAGTVVLGPVFSAVTPFVHALGWIVLAGGALWLVSKHLQEKEAIKEVTEDRDAQMKFELYLATEALDKYRTYKDAKDRYETERLTSGLDVHWHKIAQESGTPIIEIIKRR